MSSTTNQEFRSWKVVEDHLRRTVFYHSGKRLSERDSYLIGKGLFLQYLMLEDLVGTRFSDRKRRLLPWLNTMEKVDVLDLASFLKVQTSFLRNYAEGGSMDYAGFKHQFGTSYPFTGAFYAPVKEEMERFLFSPNPADFTILNQMISFLSRLNLRDVDFTTPCILDYKKIEDHLTQFRFDPNLLRSLNRIMRRWLFGLDFSELVPRHGPGGVAFQGRCSLHDKYSNICSDAMLEYFLKRVTSSSSPLFPLPAKGELHRRCEVVMVPKSIQTYRTISMEPATLQYFQQGVWDCLDKFISRSRYLSSHIHIHDQSFNRELACEGSTRSREYGTIDLSSASDCVSWELVKSVFAGTPFLRAAYATRSREVLLPTQEVVPLRKFAPMGSALCFPTECLIFAVICEYAAQRAGRLGKNFSYLVYGDDLVVHESIYHEVMDLLVKLGFFPNPSKSFHGSLPFRESCGGEYFDGVDVSPFRLSRKFDASEAMSSPGCYQSYIDLANEANRYGLKRVRLWAIHKLLDVPPHYRPFFSVEGKGIHSTTSSNYHLLSRKIEKWQEEVYLHGDIGNRHDKYIPSDAAETIRLFEWFRRARLRSRPVKWPEDLIVVATTRSRPVFRVGQTLKS